jgi:hypothetical protein
MMDQNVERRIRDRAYAIWEDEGCPEGREVEHWMRACEEIAAEDGAGGDGSGEAGLVATTEAASGEESAAAEKPKRAKAPRSAAKNDASGEEKPASRGRKSSKTA